MTVHPQHHHRPVFRLGTAALLVFLALGTAAPCIGAPGVRIDIRVKEFLQAEPPVSDWVDSNTVLLPVGVNVYAMQGNFGINLLAVQADSQAVTLQYQLATLGASVHHRSGNVRIEYGIPMVIDSIPGKGKSYYRALFVPHPAEADTSCLASVGDPSSWPYDPTGHFDLYYVRNSLADTHWNILKGFLEQDYKIVHEKFGFEYPGKVQFYFCPCRPENFDFEPGLAFAIDPSRLAGYALYWQETNTVDPQITNLLKFYRWWGFAPRLLVWGVSGYSDFVDYYARQYLQARKLAPLDSLAISAGYRSVDPLVAYYESGSFVHFLLDSIGVPGFRDLYERSTDLSLKPALLAVTGRTLGEWEAMWKKYLAAREFRYPELIYFAHRAQAIRRETEHLQLLELAIADLGDSLSVPLTQELAMSYFAAGSYADAFAAYRKLAGADPQNAEYQQYCGNAAVTLGWLDQAGEFFRRAVELDTAFAAPYLSMGEIMEAQGRTDSALALWRRGLTRGESVPVYTELLIHLASYDRRRQGAEPAKERLGVARNATARLLGQYPDSPRYLLRMADVLTQMQATDSALIYYNAAEFLEDRPFYLGEIYLGKGKAYDLAGQRAEAVQCYEKVFEVPSAYLARQEAQRYINEFYR